MEISQTSILTDEETAVFFYRFCTIKRNELHSKRNRLETAIFTMHCSAAGALQA